MDIDAGRQADANSKLNLSHREGCPVEASGEPALALERKTDHLQEGPDRIQARRLSAKNK